MNKQYKYDMSDSLVHFDNQLLFSLLVVSSFHANTLNSFEWSILSLVLYPYLSAVDLLDTWRDTKTSQEKFSIASSFLRLIQHMLQKCHQVLCWPSTTSTAVTCTHVSCSVSSGSGIVSDPPKYIYVWNGKRTVHDDFNVHLLKPLLYCDLNQIITLFSQKVLPSRDYLFPSPYFPLRCTYEIFSAVPHWPPYQTVYFRIFYTELMTAIRLTF